MVQPPRTGAFNGAAASTKVALRRAASTTRTRKNLVAFGCGVAPRILAADMDEITAENDIMQEIGCSDAFFQR